MGEMTEASRMHRLNRLYESSGNLLLAAREGDWAKVDQLLHQQSSLLTDASGKMALHPGPEGVTEEDAQKVEVIRQNMAEVQLLLNNERQNTAKRLEMIARVKKIRGTYKPKGFPSPKLHDRKF